MARKCLALAAFSRAPGSVPSTHVMPALLSQYPLLAAMNTGMYIHINKGKIHV